MGESDARYGVADEHLGVLLRGLLGANWHSLCLFTSRYRWRDYAEVVQQDIGLEIHLPELSAPQTMMLMNNLSRLRQVRRAVKIAMWRKVGGHPKTIELLNGWLADGNLTDLLEDKRLDGLLTTQWEEYFLARLLARLSDAEQAALTRLSIFQTRLGVDELAYAEVDEQMTSPLAGFVPATAGTGGSAAAAAPVSQPAAHAARGRAGQAKGTNPSGGQHTPSTRWWPTICWRKRQRRSGQELHRWAAVFYGQPFVQTARDHIARSGQSATDEQIEEVARNDRNGVVGQMVARTDDMDQAGAGGDGAGAGLAAAFVCRRGGGGGGGDCNGRL